MRDCLESGAYMRLAARIILLSIGVCLTLPLRAQVGAVDPFRAPAVAPDARHPALPDFSMRERAAMYRSVTEQKSPAAVPFDLEVGIGTILPDAIEIRPLPKPILDQIPEAKKYNYAVWREQVLLIDPADRRVADILHDYILRDQK